MRILAAAALTFTLQVRAQTPAVPRVLTRADAEQIALAHNPQVRVSQLLAELQTQVTLEVRSGELPLANGNIIGVEANEGSRLAAGALTSSLLISHSAGGVQVSQLITDFGRTRNLVASQQLRERARQADVEATRNDIVLAADQAFYQGLEAQGTLAIAEQTVKARQDLVDQVSALARSKLRSDLDLNFAAVNLSEAKLLELAARGSVDSARAALAAVLGLENPVQYQLVPDVDSLPSLPSDEEDAVAQAVATRPDLRALRFTQQAELRFTSAQARQRLPTVSALGVVGGTPYGPHIYYGDRWYGAAGININIPIFNGFRFRAEAAQAQAQADIQGEHLRDLRNRVARDVRMAWLAANTERQRVAVSAELQRQAETALGLAQTRYSLGLSSIVELSQAQLQQTQAAIGNANARSQFGLAYAALEYQIGTGR